MFADYHVHTSYSDDSEYPMEEVVRDAVSLGLEEICFTDHVDYGVKRDWDDPRGILYRRGRSGEPEHMALANVDYLLSILQFCRIPKVTYKKMYCILRKHHIKTSILTKDPYNSIA